jgi:hypothetical protein
VVTPGARNALVAVLTLLVIGLLLLLPTSWNRTGTHRAPSVVRSR